VRSTHSPDGTIVLDIRQGQMFDLNFVASQSFERITTGSTESAIIDQTSREFSVSREQAEKRRSDHSVHVVHLH